jgi:putative drug exporter of the RND superfamily
VDSIHEEWLKRRDNSAAVRIGQAITGRNITAAASIMTVVFFAFTFTTDRTIKMIGLGMATAILLDALVVRTVLVTAVMHSLSKANCYLPRGFDRRLPHLRLEDNEEVPQGTGGEEDEAGEAGRESNLAGVSSGPIGLEPGTQA